MHPQALPGNLIQNDTESDTDIRYSEKNFISTLFLILLSEKSMKSPELTTATETSQTSEPYIQCSGRPVSQAVTEIPVNDSDLVPKATTEYRMEF